MPGIKLQKFLGKAPKVASELLPDMSAQQADSVKLYSGDLIPYPAPVIVDNTERTGVIKRLHALRDPDTDELVWLSWSTDVDIATPSGVTDPTEQRFYYTGDGVPKVSTYELATTGSEPYPVDYYELGLPLPEQQPTTTVATFTTKTTSTIERDTSGVVTLVTSTDHGLKNGAFVTVSGFTHRDGTYSQTGTTITVTITGHKLSTGAQVILRFTSGDATSNVFTATVTGVDTFEVTSASSVSTTGNVEWDIRSLNATTVEATVVDDTTFQYNSPGFELDTFTTADGSVDLAGSIQARTYLYTWFTPWDEESIGSEPSEADFIREGQTVTVGNLPTSGPSGKNFVRGIRLYRTLATTTTADYLRLATLWYPNNVTAVQRTSNVSRVATEYPHNLSKGSIIKISGCSVASFDVTDAAVTEIVSDTAFEFAQVAGDVSPTTTTSGTLYIDVSENPGTTTARYWGDGSYDFVDDFAAESLLNVLTSDTYDPPPDGLQGLTAVSNNVLAGFVNNEVYFTEPGQYHAWPEDYKVTLEHNVVGITNFSGYTIILTDSYPYIISGNDPAIYSVTRIDARFPCLNKNSIVNMGFGVMYATHDGLALYSTTTGPQLVTRLLYNSDTWNEDLDPSTLVGVFFKDAYFASHSAGSIVFERDDKVGGYFVDTPYSFSTAYFDTITNKLYYVSGTNGDIYEWDDLNQPSSNYAWKSKTFVTKEPLNLGAARVVADYTNFTETWDEVDEAWDITTLAWDYDDELTFKLWVDKDLKFTKALSSSDTFRLPSGYRSDTFEVGIEGTVRVRSITLAETPLGLREV